MPSKIALPITVAAALLACNVHAADHAKDSHPASKPTHTVPIKPTIKGETEDETTGAAPTHSTDRLTIKTKSSPPFAPSIEDKKTSATTATSGGQIPLPPRDKDKVRTMQGGR